VLAGGASRRLGLDKALLPLPDGRLLIEAAIEKLATLCPEVIVVTSLANRYEGINLPARLISDRIPGQGALGGIHAALHTISTEHAMVVACDMPFLNSDLLRHMVGIERHYEALVPVEDEYWHTLHAIYARSCLPMIEALLFQGGQKLRDLLPLVRLEPLGEEEWKALDPLGLSFFNLNRPEDLLVAQQIWQ
jgi:molybdopterin-guanine dinucleotide biosynthesis protein A